MKTSLLRTDSRWFNVDWKIILKAKLSDSQRITIMRIITKYLQDKNIGINIEYTGIDPGEFSFGTEQEVRFPNNYKITTSDASANFHIDFNPHNLQPVIRHKSGQLSLTLMLEDILGVGDPERAEEPLIDMIMEVMKKPKADKPKDDKGDVSFG